MKDVNLRGARGARWLLLSPVLLLAGCGGPTLGEFLVMSVLALLCLYAGSFPLLTLGYFLGRKHPDLQQWHIGAACLVIIFGAFTMMWAAYSQVAFLYSLLPLLWGSALYVGFSRSTFKEGLKAQCLLTFNVTAIFLFSAGFLQWVF